MRKAYPNPFVPEPGYELGQYRDALTYELKGKCLQLIMDNGTSWAVHFAAEDLLFFGEYGEPMRWERYEALKLDDLTYLVEAEMEGVSPRESVTLVLDFENFLVTAIRTRIGTNMRMPEVAVQEVCFGAIHRPGEKLTCFRHGFTADLVGHRILWHESPNSDMVHSFVSERYIRFPYVDQPELPANPTAEETAERDHLREKRNSSCFEEPAFFVKIREDVYLYGFTRENDSRYDPAAPGSGLIILMNANTVHGIGSCFGSVVESSRFLPFHRTFSCFGGFLAGKDPVETQPDPYRVD